MNSNRSYNVAKTACDTADMSVGLGAKTIANIQPPVLEELRELQSSVLYLGERLQEFEKRLEPVLGGPRPCDDASKGEPMRPVCQVADAVRTERFRIRNLTGQLEELMARVEV
jgi:hypothetical protein